MIYIIEHCKQWKNFNKLIDPLIDINNIQILAAKIMMNIMTIFRLEKAQKDRNDLLEQLKIASSETLSAEERAQMMEALLQEEEAKIHSVEQLLSRLRETQFKKTEELHSCKITEKNNAAEIQVNNMEYSA